MVVQTSDIVHPAAAFRQEHQNLTEKINALCWNPKVGCYTDRLGNPLLSRKHIRTYWALIAEVATPERAESLIAKLKNPLEFGRPYGIPSPSADDHDYGTTSSHYWPGPVWCLTIYMVLNGLESYGEKNLARNIAGRFY